ncbi:MAG: O-antigen ligase family protein [Proteobacteria bacterium]|nr:O-antigen ligase family protein [Pseudomonadota bacterium]
MKAESQAVEHTSTPRPLTYLLMFTVFYIPNQRMFPDFSLTGLNITNLLFIAILALTMRNKNKDRTPAPLKTQFVFYFLILTWGLVIGQVYDASMFFGDFQTLKNAVLYMLLFFLAYYAVQDTKTIKLLFLTILFTVFFDIYLGLRQVLDYGFGYNEARRVAAPFSWNSTDANRSAAYYTIYMIPLAAAALYYRSSRLVRWGALACVVFAIFVNFFTYSRQSYGIIAVLLLLLTMRRNVMLGLLIVVALFNYHLWLPDSVIQRIDMTVATKDSMPGVVAAPLNKELDNSTESRFIIWSGAAQIIAHNPWGIGLNHFGRDIGTYAPAYAHYDAHNYFVLTTAENGVLAPVALLLLLLGLFRIGRNVEQIKSEPDAKVYGTALWLGVLAVAMVNIYGSRFVDGNLMSNFWIFAGLVTRYKVIQTQTMAQSQATPEKSGRTAAIQDRSLIRPRRAVKSAHHTKIRVSQ